MMPKMDGITVLTRLRESGNQIPVLMLTAKAEIDDRVLGLDSGRLYEKIWKQEEQEEDDPAGVVLVYISYLQTKLKALHAACEDPSVRREKRLSAGGERIR